MTDSDKDNIGIIKVEGNHIADIHYVGGSTFQINFREPELSQGEKPMTLRVEQVKDLISKNQLRLTNAPRYKEILQTIDPVTGDTPTHHADGTEKTLVERELSQLKKQGLIDDADSSSPQAGSNQQAQSTRPQPARQPEQQPADASRNPAETGSRPDSQQQAQTYRPIQPTAPISVPEQNDASPQLAPSKRKSPQLIACIIIMIIIAIVALFAGRTLSSNFGNIGNAVQNIAADNTDDSNNSNNAVQNQQNESSEQTQQDNANSNQNSNTDSSSSSLQTITRSDYDPDKAVVSQPAASDTHKDVATQMFEYIRTAFSNGDITSFQQAVNLNNISDQIATSYANITKQQQGLTDTETQSLKDYYKQTFMQEELDNASKNDIYGSIFGGRIRDVRQDSQDSNKIYAITESLGGDHQRIGFVLQSDDNGASWTVNGIINPDDYVKQIMKGNTKQYENKN